MTKYEKWVRKGCCIGFVTTKGLMLDLDHASLRKATRIAEALLRDHKLEGYLVVRSSENNYHLVFNRYLSWRTIGKILFNQWNCISWGIWQIRKGELTLRVSSKNEKNKPKIVKRVGKQDKLIADYLEIYERVEGMLKGDN